MSLQEPNDLQIALAVLQTKMEHIGESVEDIKLMLKDSVRSGEFETLKDKVQENEKEISRLKTRIAYAAGIVSIVSPVILTLLRYFIGGYFGS